MSKLITFSILAMTAMPAFANFAFVPTPDVLPLLGIGALAVLAARRFKK